ncbi:MAG: glycosyltransferase family 39 protein [Verrucomicrobia bacterium]|nr:glycosyltransferase family 39 protein [Verrucomicrobiota bacterium]
MPTIQDVLHKLEVGGGQRHIKAALTLLVLILVFVGYNIRSFRNMDTQEAMDSAQLARNLAQGEGYTTRFIRPLSMHLLQQRTTANAGGLQMEDAGYLKRPHPDISNPPVYPVLLAGLMKVLPFKYDSSNPGSFWNRDSKFWRYQPDFLISLFNQGLMVAMLVATWFLTRRLFDEEAAWVATLCLLGIELLWRFSVSGLSTMLLLLIMSGVLWLLVLLESEGREPKRTLKGIIVLAAALGLLLAIGGLTRYAFLLLILPAVAFLLLFGGRVRFLACGIVVGVFLLVVTPWIARNLHLSGLPFGTATYAPIEQTGTFSGDRLQRSLNLDVTTGEAFQARYKLIGNLRSMAQKELFQFSGTWVTGFFLVGLMVAFRNPATQRLRYFILMAFVTLALAQALGTTYLSTASPQINSENLLVILVPAIVIFGVAMFLMLLDNIKWAEPVYRKAVIVVFIALSSLPLLLTLTPPRPVAVAYPPYYPPHIQTISSWMKPEELIMSDVPWAVAWYGNRQSLWLTLDVANDFYSINDYQKPIKGLYLTPVTMDGNFASTFLRTGEFSWGDFILKSMYKGELPREFPLPAATKESLFWPEEIFLTDWNRWRTSND